MKRQATLNFQQAASSSPYFDKAAMLEDIGEKHEAGQDFVNEVVLIFMVQDVDAMYNGLKKDIPFLTDPHDRQDWIIRVAQFRDPHGTLIEIN